MTFVYAPDLYKKRRASRHSKQREEYLRANPGIDPAILAYDMGVTERFVVEFQRKLGLRKLSGTSRRGEEGWRCRAKTLPCPCCLPLVPTSESMDQGERFISPASPPTMVR
jgi:hypothetical protein